MKLRDSEKKRFHRPYRGSNLWSTIVRTELQRHQTDQTEVKTI